MKKIITGFAFATLFAACGNEPKTETLVAKDSVTTDTTGLYTDQGKVLNINGANDTTITTVTTTTVTKSGIATEVPAPKAIVKKRAASTTPRRNTSNSSVGTSGSSTTTEPVAAKKTGWSKAAKGTVIGAGSGAVLGAVVSKKKGKGAIIGGIVGAGVGYGVGRSKDKKDGRVQ